MSPEILNQKDSQNFRPVRPCDQEAAEATYGTVKEITEEQYKGERYWVYQGKKLIAYTEQGILYTQI